MTVHRSSTFRIALLLIPLLLPNRLAFATDPDELFSELGQSLKARRPYGQITSMLVWQDGNLLMEEYNWGYSPDQLHGLASTTKSVTSALIGIAHDRGLIPSLDVNVLDYFPEYAPFENLDDRKRSITLEDLLKMQAGFNWDELSVPYDSPENITNQVQNSGRDWIDYVLDVEMASDPGTEFAYNSGVTILLSGVLEKATGQSAEDFAADTLFRDLGIDRWNWGETPFGYSNTAGGLSLLPHDMLKFGQLYLNDGYVPSNGEVPGKQVISSEWVASSIQRYTEDGDIGGTGEPGSFNYGYQWWQFGDDSEIIRDLAVNDVYFTWGHGGQYIFVVPHLNAVIVSTARNYLFETEERIFPALPDYIFPALQQLAVPEPSTLLMSLLGLSAVAISRRRPSGA